jgi:transcriptional regulator with XRE-family HTH domain
MAVRGKFSNKVAWKEKKTISDMKKSFGEILHYARKSRSLTIKQLEKKSGVSASFISRIENDTGNPSIEIVRKLATALGVPLSDFFHDQKGGKILYPLRLTQARLIQDNEVVSFLDSLISLSPEQRGAVLQIASGAVRMFQDVLEKNPKADTPDIHQDMEN